MAGNTTSIAIAYNVIYQFVGFLQPVDDTGRLSICGSPCPISIFRGGSTIPIKFQLEDANGNIVQSASLPIWITPVQGAATNLSINTSNYKGPGTSGADYTYNVTGQQYEFDWNTKGYATGYLWIIGAQLDDGQTYTVTIGLK
jgi:hypothetical protein